MKDKPVVWVLADDRAGNVSQCLGLAENLGLGFIRKNIGYSPLIRLPNALIGRSLCALDRESKKRIVAPWPDLVIAAGRRTASIARYIKKQSANKAKLVQIMDPGVGGRDEFDLICIPEHDGSEIPFNGIKMLGAPHRVTEHKLSEARDEWKEKFAHLKGPLIALIVGGATKSKAFSQDDARELGRTVNELAEQKGGSILVTTSRRTGNAAQALLSEIKVPSFQFKWGDTGENPYFGFLAMADELVVTGDSVSMCSEACSTGKPVLIYAPNDMISEKHARFVSSLVEGNYAKLLGEEEKHDDLRPLQTTEQLADAVKFLLNKY